MVHIHKISAKGAGFWSWVLISSLSFDVETEEVFTVWVVFRWFVPEDMKLRVVASLKRKFEENKQTVTIFHE